MTTSSEVILITTLAEYQTRFWIPVAQRLRKAGRDVQLLAFDEFRQRLRRVVDAAVVIVLAESRRDVFADDARDGRVGNRGL